MVAPYPTTSQGELHAALNTVKMSQLKTRIRHLYFSLFSVHTSLYHWIASCREPFEVNRNYYLEEMTYKIQYICREKERIIAACLG